MDKTNKPMLMKIVTAYEPKPSHIRTLDWHAQSDSYEPGDPIGYGATEEAAIADLNSQLDELRPDPLEAIDQYGDRREQTMYDGLMPKQW